MTDHRIAAVILAAGASRRMRGRDKLTELAGSKPLLRCAADAAWGSQASEVVVVLGARADARQQTLKGLAVRCVHNRAWQEGMGGSIRVGIESLSEKADGAVLMLADMPDIDTNLLNGLITLFDPLRGIDIVRPRAASGPVGNPILFGKRYFPQLLALKGDVGAKCVVDENRDCVVDYPTGDDSVLVDLDTPDAWRKWQSDRQG